VALTSDARATISTPRRIHMAILKVARLGHPVLRQVAEPIDVDAIRSWRPSGWWTT